MKALLTALLLISTSAYAAPIDCDMFAATAKASQQIRQTWFKDHKKDITRAEFKALIDKVSADEPEARRYFYTATSYVFGYHRSTPAVTVEERSYPKCETANAIAPLL